jgi:hypothetical protein
MLRGGDMCEIGMSHGIDGGREGSIFREDKRNAV